MIEISRILCPVDFSDFSRHALDHATALARRYGAALTALHVRPPLASLAPMEPFGFYPSFVYTPEDLDQFRTALERFVQDESGTAGVPLGSVLAEGPPAATIVEWAETLPADVVVMGTHGRTGFERFVLGSVTERVLRGAPCPVLTVPPRVPDAVPIGPQLYTRILCAVDFSPSSVRALESACSIAMEAHARLSVLHVVEVPVPALEPAVAGGAVSAPFEEARLDTARRRLHEAIHDDARSSCDVREVVTSGKPYREILRVANADRADLVVMGVHGGMAGALGFGSTTNHVVRAAACPVLTLRA